MTRPPSHAGADQDRAMLRVLRDFIAAPKTLAGPVRWIASPPHWVFVTVLDIGGVTEPGFQLRGRASLALPGQDVSLQLIRTDLGRRGRNFDRLDWRPLQPHRNKQHSESRLAFREITGSHRHPVVENAAHPAGLLAALDVNLPVAVPLDEDPPDWAALAALAGRLWSIAGLGDAAAPPWQDELAALRGRTS
jgi:hypothetical protein